MKNKGVIKMRKCNKKDFNVIYNNIQNLNDNFTRVYENVYDLPETEGNYIIVLDNVRKNSKNLNKEIDAVITRYIKNNPDSFDSDDFDENFENIKKNISDVIFTNKYVEVFEPNYSDYLVIFDKKNQTISDDDYRIYGI